MKARNIDKSFDKPRKSHHDLNVLEMRRADSFRKFLESLLPL
jgi:hypothetical protein